VSLDAGLSAWLRLTLTPGIGGQTQRRLLAAFGAPERIFNASHTALSAVCGSPLASQLLDNDNSKAVEHALAWAGQPGNSLLALDDVSYPRALLATDDPPCLLYCKGLAALLQDTALAIVGSRNATPQGIRNAENFAGELADNGLTIVSGLALGIDAAAHRGALAAAGNTIAVIGTGADRLYPARNRELAEAIAQRGLIISEFPLGTPPAAANFPRRNRLISGLARGVLVIEAAVESGSLITARLAGEQGREAFAIPGSIHSPLSRGCHALIKQGAKLVESAADIIEELAWNAAAAPVPGPTPPPELDQEHTTLLTQIGHDPCEFDELAERSGLTADRLLAMLLALELDGHIASLPGNLYQRLAKK
jgi:DNA processing protein